MNIRYFHLEALPVIHRNIHRNIHNMKQCVISHHYRYTHDNFRENIIRIVSVFIMIDSSACTFSACNYRTNIIKSTANMDHQYGRRRIRPLLIDLCSLSNASMLALIYMIKTHNHIYFYHRGLVNHSSVVPIKLDSNNLARISFFLPSLFNQIYKFRTISEIYCL